MKKLGISLITLGVLFGVVVAKAPSVLGFSIWKLGDAIEVSTAMSAKLACSAKYITGLDDSEIIEDLASYSPAIKAVSLTYDINNKYVTATMFGMAEMTAQYRDGLGCSLQMDGSTGLDSITTGIIPSSSKAWPIGSSTDHIDDALQASLNSVLEQDNDKGLKTRALVMVKNGQIIAEAYGEGITEKTPLLGWSMAKSFTAIMTGRMQQLNMIEPSQTQLFEEWQHNERKNLSLEHLLHMSSGLGFDETYAPGSDSTRMLFTEPSASNVAIASELSATPGTHFSYSSGTTNLLNRFMHKTLGDSTQLSLDFLHTEVLTPLNMRLSTFETDSSGVFVGSSYLYASARDWARLGLLMINNGQVGDTQFLPKEWVKAASSPNNSDNDKRYGYQFWLNSGNGKNDLRWPQLPEDAYAMMGNRKQSVMIIPSQNMVFVRLGWTRGDYPMEQNYKQLLAQVSTGENNE